MINSELLSILACPVCKAHLIEKNEKLICTKKQCNEEYDIFEGIPILISKSKIFENKIDFTISRWEEVYNEIQEKARYKPNDIRMRVNRLIIEKYMDSSEHFYLEAGCGVAKQSLDVALNHPHLTIVCLDIVPNALLRAKQLFYDNNAHGLFVCGDLRELPLKGEIFDFIFSDGTIEHIKKTSLALNELYRVLIKGGKLLVTVPLISFAMLTHGQLHGNIPNIPSLKSLFEFIHIGLLKGKHMKHGYELSFTENQLKHLLKHFVNVEVGLLYGALVNPINIWRGALALKIRKLFGYMIYGFGFK